MGSDSSPQILFPALLEAHEQFGHEVEFFVIFATHQTIKTLHSIARDFSKIRFVEAESAIEMEDSPLLAVRRKKKSSLLLGIKEMANGNIDALVSAGNTGAMIAGASLLLEPLPHVARPGLLAFLPTQRGRVAVIDVGGNVHGSARQLVQFAQMGVAFQKAIGKADPKIGLLNIGIESIKGTSEVRKAYHLFEEMFGNAFVGNIEGPEVFQGKVDILITDGFTGNVFLKTSEGISQFILQFLSDHPRPIHDDTLLDLNKLMSYDEYPGAVLCGVQGLIVKCHGYATPKAFYNGIKGAAFLLKKQLLPKMISLLA